MLELARTELILGGQKSGKSRRAEALAAAWMAGGASRRAVLVATAEAGDEEMRARIERHRRDRVAGLAVLEVPRDLAGALARLNDPQTLVVIDCLTLWLTNRLMPLHGAPDRPEDVDAAVVGLQDALRASAGPVFTRKGVSFPIPTASCARPAPPACCVRRRRRWRTCRR